MHSASNAVHYSGTASSAKEAAPSKQLLRPILSLHCNPSPCTASAILSIVFRLITPQLPSSLHLDLDLELFWGLSLRFSLRLADMPTMQSLGMAGNQEEDLCEALWLDLISLLGNPTQSTSQVDLIFKAWRASQGK